VADVDNARKTVLALLAHRASDATVCPSEVARALAAQAVSETRTDDWRVRMPVVHAAIDSLVEEGAIRLSWKGRPLAKRVGPYRIARAPSP
jgi:hypothetical protein